jgi:hypothetical protein
VARRPPFFVTGAQRSGTTLLGRRLAGAATLSVLSQPLPLVHVGVKRAFLSARGWGDPYPLGDLFRERRYRAEEWLDFLSRFQAPLGWWSATFEEQEHYSGQYDRFDRSRGLAIVEELAGEQLATVLAGLWEGLSPRGEALAFGAKETSCEEYLPYLLSRSVRCLLVLRDPRGVLASLNHGRGRAFGGRLKPTLFNVRVWRKSARFALRLQGRPGFRCLRFAALSDDEEIERAIRWLGVEPSASASGLMGEDNSSFVSVASRPKPEVVLPRSVWRFVEAACWAELGALGFERSLREVEVPDVLRDFVDPYPLERPHLSRYLAPERISEELERWEDLAGDMGEREGSLEPEEAGVALPGGDRS